MTNTRKAETLAPYVLLGLTAVTGILDAVSFLALGRVFTANMTGNVAILAFAAARVPGLSVGRSLTALTAFLSGAAFGGWVISKADESSLLRFASRLFAVEIAFLSIAAGCAIGYGGKQDGTSLRTITLVALTAIAMGIRNAAVRKLAIPDLTTTVLTLTVTAIAADSSFAGGSNPRLGRRVGSVVSMFVGAGVGAILIRYSVAGALALAAALSILCTVALLWSLRDGSPETNTPGR
ncbi:MAG TPA: YoaK family protein [Candidatus Acidoferrum sp.]|nr:YoaK family protein [Candidatus Acidoferrum sp.]